MKKRCSPKTVFLLLFLFHLPMAVAAADIYTCVDANGRHLTSDRPISNCLDREQYQLSRSGIVKRILPPSYTASEAAAIEARKKQAEMERQQAKAQTKGMAALLQRYPNASTHQTARMLEAETITARIREGYARLGNARNERAQLENELAFYVKAPQNMPENLRQQLQVIDDSEKSANNYIIAQRKELVALHKRYDAELAILKILWKQ